MTDQENVLRACTELRKIAAEYIIEPDPRDAEITMQQMLSILDRRPPSPLAPERRPS